MNELLVAATGTSFTDHWRVIIAVAIVVGVATLSLTRTSSRLRRHRSLALLLSSGWVAIALGVAVGTSGLRLIDARTINDARPLAMLALTWVGLIVGLQLRRAILTAIPSAVWRTVVVDVVATTTIATLGWLALRARVTDAPWLPFAVTAAAGGFLGWSPETRSFGLRAAGGGARTFVQAGAGLAGVSLVLGVAVADLLAPAFEDGGLRSMGFVAMGTALGLLAAVGTAIGARILLGRVQRHQPETLVVLLGMIALLSGVADRLDLSPLFVGAACGAAIANSHGASMRDLESTIARAEPALATVVFVMTGVLLHGSHLGIALVVAAAIVAHRLALKPFLVRLALGPAAPEIDRQIPLRGVTLREAPLALAVGCSIVLEHGGGASTALAALAIAAAAGVFLLPAALRTAQAEPAP